MSVLVAIVGLFAVIFVIRKLIRFAIKAAIALMLLMVGQEAFFGLIGTVLDFLK